jgi:hypothetical protein
VREQRTPEFFTRQARLSGDRWRREQFESSMIGLVAEIIYIFCKARIWIPFH